MAFAAMHGKLDLHLSPRSLAVLERSEPDPTNLLKMTIPGDRGLETACAQSLPPIFSQQVIIGLKFCQSHN